MSYRELDLAWKDFFIDPSAYWHIRNNKSGSSSPGFKQKKTKKVLWIHNSQNPPWVKVELLSRDEEEMNGENLKYKVSMDVDDDGDDDRASLLQALKACGKQKDLDKGSRIHNEILKKISFKKDVYVNTALISMYAKCGAVEKAQKVFDNLLSRNVVCWNALISCYVKHGQSNKALEAFERMQDEGFSPDAFTFSCLLKACGSMGLLGVKKGEEIHDEVCRHGLLEKDIVLCTSLVDMYARSGALVKAQEVFDVLPIRDVTTWTALIGGYTQHGFGDEALKCYKRMRGEGVPPNAVTFGCVLRACGIVGNIEKGEEVHVEVKKQGLLNKDVVLGTSLVDMYAKCGALVKAQKVFDGLPLRSLSSWNVLISGYVRHELNEEALDCYKRMRAEGISPNAAIFSCVLKACGCIRSIEKGEEIHREVRKQGLVSKDMVLGTALVSMYAKCGMVRKAQEIFDELPRQDSVAWNSLIMGYADQGYDNEALKCFREMRDKGLSPDAITYACALKSCSNTGLAEKGMELHAEAKKHGLLDNNIVLNTALVDMYAKCGMLEKAKEVFYELPSRDSISWTAMIAGYVYHGFYVEALNCFGQMQDEGFSPSAITFACILKACGNIGSFEKGEELHAEIRKRDGLLEDNIMLGTALVDMYAKCGMLARAQDIFNDLPTRDVFSFNSLISGYAQLGEVQCVLQSFDKMRQEGVVPNMVTFNILLSACSHAGLVDEGQMYFDCMNNVYNLTPTSEHYSCMVDLFSRAGHFDKAMTMIKKVPNEDSSELWLALLGACKKWRNVELGIRIFEHLIRLDGNNVSAYVCMSNIYADAGMQEEANKIEALRLKNRAKELSELRWLIDKSGNVYSFSQGHKIYPQSKQIYLKLADMGSMEDRLGAQLPPPPSFALNNN